MLALIDRSRWFYALAFGLMVQVCMGNWAHTQEEKVRQEFPLTVKLVGYMVTNNSRTVLLEIDGQSLILSERKKISFKHPKLTKLLQARPAEGSSATAGTCVISFEKGSLDLEDQSLLLGTAPFDPVRCPLGQEVRPSAGLDTDQPAAMRPETELETPTSQPAVPLLPLPSE